MIRSTFSYLISVFFFFHPPALHLSARWSWAFICFSNFVRFRHRRILAAEGSKFSRWVFNLELNLDQGWFFVCFFLLLLMLHHNTSRREWSTRLRLIGLWGAQSVGAYKASRMNPRANSNLQSSTFIFAHIVQIKHVFAGPWMQSWMCFSQR